MQRRHLQLNSVAELRQEVELICTRPVKVAGNWSEAQVVQHVARLMEFSYDGFPFRAPWYVRRIARLFLPRVLRRGFKPGFRLPEMARSLLPDEDVSMATAAAQMGVVLRRLEQGEPMSQDSPVFGPLSHEQWVELHLRHAEHHFSFVIPQETAD